MKNYRLLNNLVGWATFAIAAIVYLLTIEPTASFWDCGEFISTAFKLEVGHPPGAPFFMLLGRFFTLFAGNNHELVPVMVNAFSALCSAFTILFLFWSITHLARKIVGANESDLTFANKVAIIGSGLVGALAYTFSDTFWFSAVEGEVYAASSLFTAVVFWAILKWEDCADEPFANRWLILIAYLMGLSIGVHLLNLLAIPAIVFVYYFKKYPVTRKNTLIALGISVLVLAAVMYGIISGMVKLASVFELMFINGFGLPYDMGLLIFVVLLVGALVWAIWFTYKKRKAVLNTIVLAFTVIMLGYSSYAVIVLRSLADTPMDQNDPENMFSLLSYLNREQYGDRPLLFGQFFSAQPYDTKESGPVYTPINGKYVETSKKIEYIYDDALKGFFPRMWSSDPMHVQAYKQWSNVKGTKVRIKRPNGETKVAVKPTFAENMKFFVRYQIGFMYMRYFMWNFAGRQNDIQGHGDITKGNWISGIKFIDELRLGPQDNLPPSLANNKARNKYFMLPLILGLVGLIFHLKKQKHDFTIVSLLFLLTGIAIVVYLNQTPYQPRERDYAYAGSFYAFAIWIGLGVLALYDALKKVPALPRAIGVTVVTLALVPGIMASENWDDHDRSGRYTARDFAYNYLNSCEKNAIIFTNGDNDTFPLWYAQEVEGIRTDVRVVNLSYLGADWYIRQMMQKAYESDPLPISFKEEQFRQGNRDFVYLIERNPEAYVPLKNAMAFLRSENDSTKRVGNYPDRVDYLPARKFKINIDPAQILSTGSVAPEMASRIVPEMQWEIKDKQAISKSEMMVLDFVNTNDWKRPIYFAITVSNEYYLGLDNYFMCEGLAYRLVPINSPSEQGQVGGVNTSQMYDNMINKFRWGGVNNPNVYLDENNQRMLMNFRNNFARLAEALIAENKTDSALVVLDRCEEVMPNNCVPYNLFNIPLAECYYRINKPDKANAMVKTLADASVAELKYFLNLPRRFQSSGDRDKQLNLYILSELSQITARYGQADLANQIKMQFDNLINLYQK